MGPDNLANRTVERCSPVNIESVAGEPKGSGLTNLTPKKEENKERKKLVFLRALGDTGNVSLACKRAAISRETAYQWRKNDERFCSAWDNALEIAIDSLEAEAIKRAKKNSDVLMIFLLKAHRPQKYRERFVPDVKNLPEIKAMGKALVQVLEEYVPREHFQSAFNRLGQLTGLGPTAAKNGDDSGTKSSS